MEQLFEIYVLDISSSKHSLDKKAWNDRWRIALVNNDQVEKALSYCRRWYC